MGGGEAADWWGRSQWGVDGDGEKRRRVTLVSVGYRLSMDLGLVGLGERLKRRRQELFGLTYDWCHCNAHTVDWGTKPLKPFYFRIPDNFNQVWRDCRGLCRVQLQLNSARIRFPPCLPIVFTSNCPFTGRFLSYRRVIITLVCDEDDEDCQFMVRFNGRSRQLHFHLIESNGLYFRRLRPLVTCDIFLEANFRLKIIHDLAE